MSESFEPDLPIRPEANPEQDEKSFFSGFLRHMGGLSREVIIYGLGGMAGQLMAFFIVPVLTRTFSIGEYGTVDLINTTVNFFALLLGLNLVAGMYRYYYEIPAGNTREQVKLISTTLVVFLVIALSFTILSNLFAGSLSTLIFKSKENESVLRLALFIIPLHLVHKYFIGLQRIMRKPTRYLVLSLGYTVLYYGLTILFVVVLKTGIKGVFTGQLIGYAVMNLVGLWMGRSILIPVFSTEWLKKTLVYALPLIPGSLISWFLGNANRFFLNSYASVEQVGLYSLASKVSVIIMLLISAFQMAWPPFSLSILHKPDVKKIYALVLSYFMLATVMLAGILTLFSPELFIILAPPAYLAGLPIVTILLLRQVISGGTNILGISVIVSKKTIYTSYALAIAAVVNLASNLLLTSRYGVYGAAVSELLGFVVSFITYYFFAKQLYEIPWNIPLVIKTLLGYLVISAISIGFLYNQPFSIWLVLGKLVIVAVLGWYLTRFIPHEQRSQLITSVPGWIKRRLVNLFSSRRS